MAQDNKDLLLQDLCARLPYGVIGAVEHYDEVDGSSANLLCTLQGFDNKYKRIKFVYLPKYTDDVGAYNWFSYIRFKPYLRPMSSMTKEEKNDLLVTIVGNKGSKYFRVLQDGSIDNTDATIQDLNKFNMHWVNFDKDTVTLYIDWLNQHHFDYRGLIQKGLAISTEEFNPYKD